MEKQYKVGILMEYKNMREIYKGNICEIRQPEFIGADKHDNYRFIFG